MPSKEDLKEWRLAAIEKLLTATQWLQIISSNTVVVEVGFMVFAV
jgi:hypothetical protein